MASKTPSSPQYLLDDLRRAITEGRVLAIIGAGVSIGASGGNSVASWVGLLKHGVQRCVDLYGDKPRGWSRQLFEEIDSGDSDELLTAAHKISTKLDAPSGGEYRRWLQDTAGSMHVKDSSVIEALAALNIQLSTTNYDGLIEQVTGLNPITWQEHALMEQVLRGDRKAILHLHGYWDKPESVVLDIRSYESILRNEYTQFTQRLIRGSYTLLFVGYGKGLADPNFSSLLRWSTRLFADSTYRNFRLVLRSDVEAILKEHTNDERIYVLPFGDSHSDLAPFLLSLLPSQLASKISPGTVVPQSIMQSSSTNIPTATTKNILSNQGIMIAGRDQELAELRGLLVHNPQNVIAIIGPSGYGKTVLARQLVAKLGDGTVEAYIDASLVSSVQTVARHLVNLFPEEAWQSLVRFGGLRIDQLNTRDLERFVADLVINARCCLVVDHAESWLNEKVAQQNQDLHAALAMLAREATHLACILTSVQAPSMQLPYRVVVYPLGPTDEEKGVAILSRHIVASKSTLSYITKRFHGHPYVLDLVSRRFAGTYQSRDSKSNLLKEIAQVPDDVIQLLQRYLAGLSLSERRLLLGIANFGQPIPSQWTDHKIAASLYERGFLAHKVDLDAETAGWVVHPLVHEAVELLAQYREDGQANLRRILQHAVHSGHALASLPLAYNYASSGDYRKAFTVASDYWRFWCESKGIDEGLRFIESLSQDPTLSRGNQLSIYFAASVLHLYKGDKRNLIAAKEYLEKVVNAGLITKTGQALYWAAFAEQMEVTRRLEGINATVEMYSSLVKAELPKRQKPEYSYHQGLVFFLLGHVYRYAENFDRALEYYRRANHLFRNCTAMNCRMEERHTAYSMGISYLKAGDIEAASQIIDTLGIDSDQGPLTFIGGLLAYLQSAIALATNQPEKAIILATESINSFKQFQSYAYGARAELLLAWARLLSGQNEAALSIFRNIMERTSLPKSLLGRAECGFTLSNNDEDIERYWPQFQSGIEKILDSGDMLGAMSIMKRSITRDSGQRRLYNLRLNWGEIQDSNHNLMIRSKSVAEVTMSDLYETLSGIRPQAPETIIDTIGFV